MTTTLRKTGSTVRAGIRAFAAAFLACLAVAFAPAALAQANSIESVSSVQQGSTTYLRIGLKNPPTTAPAGFSVANPPRIAFDFTNTDNKVGKNSLELPQGDVRSVAIVQSGERARVVLNLKRSLSYNTSIEGNTLVVALEPVATAGAAAAPSAYSFAKADGKGSHSLRDIDFRRGKEGEGRVVVDLSDPGVGVDIRQQGQSIVVDFLNASLPENLRRRLDVGDFGTPVTAVRAVQQGDNARLVIEPHGDWEHNAYQSDTQFVVEVKPVRADPTRLARGLQPGYRGEKLSLNFQSVDIRALLQVIADFTNLNIVTSDSVAGNLTLRLKDVPWDQALDIILQSKGLDMRKNGNVIMVAPRDEIAAKEKLELESRAQISEIEPVRTETFQLNYQKADALHKLLSDDKQRVLSKRGSVVVDERTNKVFVQDTVTRLEEVRKIIAQIDVPVRQVLIEARIVEADDRFSRNLGVRLGFNRINASAGSFAGRGTVSGNLQGVHDLTPLPGSLSTGTTALANTNFVNLPAANISGVNPSTFAISLFNSSLTRFLNLELSALEADQRGKVVSSPRVLTADQGKAIIEQGTELPYQQATSSGATSISFRKANLKLEVTPQITPEGNVILAVEVNRDAVGQLTPAGFAIDTRRVQTQVLVENGGTVVIGGIYEQFERSSVNKVPLLGDLPIVGNAFKNTNRTNDRTELLVFLTPRVVTDTAMAR
ncbi:MAG TPA: type IV pilus secretin PilQ [Burkholderiaceae bacterium]|jgi:type IV pilus assembly protein PilQ|nr:type IV pilus secretin PilQ [Burkholderiaceae bacterium]